MPHLKPGQRVRAERQALAIPGQSDIVVPTDYSNKLVDTTGVSVNYDRSRGITLASAGYGSLSLQQNVNGLIGDVAVSIRNQLRDTAPATKAPGPREEKCRYGDKCTKQGKGCKYQHPVSKQAPKQRQQAPKQRQQAPKQRQQAPKQNDDVIDKLLARNDQLRTEIQEKDDTISSHEQTIRNLFVEIESLRKQLQSGSIGSWDDATDDQDVNQNTDQVDDRAARLAVALG